LTLEYIDDAKTSKQPYKILTKEIVFNEKEHKIGRNKDPATKKAAFDAVEISGWHAELFSDSIKDLSTNGIYLY
jgi:hypothetical protein